jgi:hypothetical protein
LSTPPVVVTAVTPLVLNEHAEGLTVMGYVNVVLLTHVIVKVPTYRDSLAPTGLPAMLMEFPVPNE